MVGSITGKVQENGPNALDAFGPFLLPSRKRLTQTMEWLSRGLKGLA